MSSAACGQCGDICDDNKAITPSYSPQLLQNEPSDVVRERNMLTYSLHAQQLRYQNEQYTKRIYRQMHQDRQTHQRQMLSELRQRHQQEVVELATIQMQESESINANFGMEFLSGNSGPEQGVPMPHTSSFNCPPSAWNNMF